MTHQSTRVVMEQWGQVDTTLKSLLAPLRSEQQYQEALAVFEELLGIAEAGTDPSTLELVGLIGENIQRYEQEDQVGQAAPQTSAVDVLHFLMEQHGLSQRDLPEIGSQGVVSEVLSGKRRLNVRQIQALGERFRVKPELFMG